MTDRRREPHILNSHTPTLIGGSRCTIICKCGWSTHDYLTPQGAWPEYHQHKKEILKENP